MKRLAKYFFQGILFILPVTLTIYIVVGVFRLTDSLLGRYFIALGVDIPGLGLLASVVVITAVGLLGNWFVSRRLLELIDTLFGRVPLVKTIYTVIKDTMNALVGNRSSFTKAVMIGLPGDERIKVLGFITAEELATFGLKDYVAVYVLQSMQWAGITLLVPRSRVELLDVSPERALQFIVSAGITGRNHSNGRSGLPGA